MEKQAKSFLENDIIDEKVDVVNTRVVSRALLSAFVMGAVLAMWSPLSTLLVFTVLFPISFVGMYEILFYCFGKELILEAKKRGKYWMQDSDYDDDEIATYTPYTSIHSSISRVISSSYDAINIANGNPPGLGYIGPIRNSN